MDKKWNVPQFKEPPLSTEFPNAVHCICSGIAPEGLIFFRKLIIVSMAIFISVLIRVLFYFLFNCFGMLIFT